jgi:arginine decarboxylase
LKGLQINSLHSDWVSGVSSPACGMILGNRIPKDYFVTSGCGESDITIHAGSYHLALKQAGIERANIITYSSILPGIAKEVEKPADYVHGEVMETIMAVANGERGQELSAGIIIGWLHDKITGERYGGLVCEHNGNFNDSSLTEKLNASLDELYTNGFSDNYFMKDIFSIKKSFVAKKKYGTALVALCFSNYFYPIIDNNPMI